MAEIKVAIIGIGNVGGTFVQGIDYYGNSSSGGGGNKDAVGLWHRKVAGFRPSDVRIVAAFDIDPTKVGKPLSQVATESTKKYHQVKGSKVTVSPGLLAPGDSNNNDNSGRGSSPSPPHSTAPSFGKFVDELSDSRAGVVLNLISSGMDRTSAEYAKAALEAGASFVNATPARIATNAGLAKKFAEKKLVLAGDDLLSQFGGTAFHKGMIDFMVERGVHVSKSYQLDVGGSAETKKTMDERIKMMKRSMKTESIGMEAPYGFDSVAGTTEYTDFLGDSRNSYYWMSSAGFLGSGIVMDLTLRTSDGANAGNVLLDVVRAASARGVRAARAAETIGAYGFKNPPKKYKIREAYANFVKLYRAAQ